MKQRIPQSFCNLNFPHTITRWDEAVPLGNGVCGALIWGAADALRFSLDRGDIWDTRPCPHIDKARFCYSEMVHLARKKKEEEIRRIFDAPYNHPLPSKLPAGKIIFDFGTRENVASLLDISKAQASISIGGIRLESFLHAGKNIGYIRVNLPENSFRFRIENPQFGLDSDGPEEGILADSVNTASLKVLRYPAPEILEGQDMRYFVQTVSGDFSYGIFVKAKEEKGHTLLVYTVETGVKEEKRRREVLAELEEALETGYEKALAEHCKWWEGFWAESSIHVPDPFFEKNWYLTNYFLASCSRKGGWPMPLQGVWTADDGQLPPWKGDYHHDLNTEMSYYSYLKANHLEEGECFIDYLWGMAHSARRFARDFYGTDGLCLPSVMSLDGAPLGGWGMYSLSPTNQLWLCQAFERYYRYTGDRQFLIEKAYPYLSETAEMILGLLEEKEGVYHLPISSSPEIHDDTIRAFVTPDSNYDLALMRYLFLSLSKLARVLEKEEEERWEAALEKLPLPAVTEEGILMISPDEALQESHRHHAHAMAVHPLRLITYDTEEGRRIIDATIRDLERLGTGMWVGYSFAWMAELYAIQRNGNGAAHQLAVFWRNHCSPNGFHLNGDYLHRGTSSFHYRPFTLEGNFCAADALQEMLLQSEEGVLRFFPAIPREWEKETVSFERFRAEHGLLVSARMSGGRITDLLLCPEHDGRVILAEYEKIRHLICALPLEITLQGENAEVFLCGGNRYHFYSQP